jgi:hypothetical protein
MKNIFLILIAIFTLSSVCAQSNQVVSNLEVLDANKDGIIDPYEALDVLLSMQKETGSKLSLKNMTSTIAAYNKEKQQENDAIFKDVDKNKNDIIEMSEATEEMMQFLPLMDVDGSKSVTKEEMANFNFENVFFLSDKQLKEQVVSIFKQFVGSKDEILIKEVPKDIQEELTGWDENEDGKITKQEAFKGIKPGSSAAQFKVEGNIAYMTGTIGSSTPAAVLELIFEHPNVKIIEMINVPGSVDDVANLRASLYVHKYGLNTRVNSKSFIASGGTDFFLAGHKREIEKGAKIGVHSWSGGSKPATELPRSDEAHKKYLDYYNKVNISESFYWYTLEASPANSIHNMTEDEIVKYKIRTK